MANIQRNGTFSVVPRIAGGEVAPEGLIAIGQVAKDYGLYTKITGLVFKYFWFPSPSPETCRHSVRVEAAPERLSVNTELTTSILYQWPAYRSLWRSEAGSSRHLGSPHCRGLREWTSVRQEFEDCQVLRRFHLVPLRCWRFGRTRDRPREPLPRSSQSSQVQGRSLGLCSRVRRGPIQGLWSHRHG